MQHLIFKIKNLFQERDWIQFHSPKNLAINLNVECGELLEHFTWVTEEESFKLDKEVLAEVKSEIGDVALNLLYLSEKLGIDLAEAIEETIVKINHRYPVDACKGKYKKIKN